MQIRVVNRFSGAVIFEREAASLKIALEAEGKGKGDLRGADLRGADLRGADLWGADLRGADLWGARGIDADRVDGLRLLAIQSNPLRAYKLITATGEAPYNGGINYLQEEQFEADIDADESHECGAGINLATLAWCVGEWREGYRILIMEFEQSAENPLVIPFGTDGKFRVRRCRRVGEVPQERIREILGLDAVGEAETQP